MTKQNTVEFVDLDVGRPIWNRFHTVAPLVLVGTREADGAPDQAPKHMATPLGWDNWFGFVCTPRHNTYANIRRTGQFAVSFPRPRQVLFTSLAASPRCPDDSKPIVDVLELTPALKIDADHLKDSYLHLECELHRIYDDFGTNSLIAGRVIAARAHPNALRSADRDPQAEIAHAPLLAYLPPDRYARIDESFSLPTPTGMRR